TMVILKRNGNRREGFPWDLDQQCWEWPGCLSVRYYLPCFCFSPPLTQRLRSTRGSWKARRRKGDWFYIPEWTRKKPTSTRTNLPGSILLLSRRRSVPAVKRFKPGS